MATEYIWGMAKQNALARLSATQRHAIARAQAEQTLARLRAWDEGRHPRHPPGSPQGGEFAGGGGSTPKLPGVADVPPYEGRREGDTYSDGKPIRDYREAPSYLQKSKTLDGVTELTTVLYRKLGGEYYQRYWATQNKRDEPQTAIYADRAGRIQTMEVTGSSSFRDDPHRETVPLDERRAWDEAKHPRHPPGSPQGGEFAPVGETSSGTDEPDEGTNYGLVPEDVARFKELKTQWAQVNNELLQHVDEPDGAASAALMAKLKAIVQEIQTLRADPGTPAGIGLPGGPRDVVIVGAGPGGLAAGINGAAEGLDTLVIEANVVAGGQAKFSSRIENFPGFPVGVTGERLTQNMFEQATRLGATTELGVRVTGMMYDPNTGLKTLMLSNGKKVTSRAVILAGGVEFRRMSFPGSEGPGVIVGDGKALAKTGKGGNVIVIGGSNGAAQAALGCASTADRVYLMARSPIVNSMSDYQVAAVRANPKVTVIEGDSIAKLVRDEQGNPQSIETTHGKVLQAKAVGLFIGSMPDTKWVPADVAVGQGGRIKTNSDLETPLPGVYAIGDMRDGAVGRIGVAVGEGQLALRQANLFLDAQRQGGSAQKSASAASAPAALINRLFALDHDNPWFGQTMEGVTPLKKRSSGNVKRDEARVQRFAVARAQAEQTLARVRAWDESKHPRDPAGTSTGGQFTSGGGGGESAKPSDKKPGEKKPKTAADFAEDDVGLDKETRENPEKQKKFLAVWNDKIGEDPAEFRKEFLGGLKSTMHIEYDDGTNSIGMRGTLLNDEGREIGTYTREINFEKNRAYSLYFKLNGAQQHKDIGKKLLAANVAYYEKIGVEKVSVSANIDVGGYAWARYGYVPTTGAWDSLSSEIIDKIDEMSSGSGGGGGGYRPESWDEMGESQRDEAETEYIRLTEDDFYDSEVENWRESGQPLDDAKVALAEDPDEWMAEAIANLREKRESEGKPPWRFTDEQLMQAIEVSYDSDGEGRNDLDISFDDDKLQEPIGYDPKQELLPGIEKVEPHEMLTEQERNGLESSISKAFEREAESKAGDMDPPDYLRENLRDLQREIWDSMEDSDKFAWIERHAPEVLGGDEDQPSEGTGEIDDDTAEMLRDLARSSDPKALWQIADSEWGKELLLGTSWSGVLNLRDPDTMERFNAYVGKQKA